MKHAMRDIGRCIHLQAMFHSKYSHGFDLQAADSQAIAVASYGKI